MFPIKILPISLLGFGFGSVVLCTAVADPGPERADVLLVTSEDLREAWGEFAEWKSVSGKETAVVTVAEIREGYAADSVQEQIRLCVRDHID